LILNNSKFVDNDKMVLRDHGPVGIIGKFFEKRPGPPDRRLPVANIRVIPSSTTYRRLPSGTM